MAPDPDYRADKMESREGRGLARERYLRWLEQIPQDVQDIAWGGGNSAESLERHIGKAAADDFWKKIATEARERSELIGFWVSWHLAGGFGALEGAGWNRATIFRKVRRFRAVFGEHPDAYQFDSVTLNPTRTWSADLEAALTGDPRPL